MIPSRRLSRSAALATLAATITLGAGVATANAQIGIAPDPVAGENQRQLQRPPRVENPAKYNGLITMGVIVACTLAAIGVAIIPSQRTHQD